MSVNLEQQVEELKNLADHLVPYTWPLSPKSLEDDIFVLRMKSIQIDGYHVLVNFTRADYGDYYLETVQIEGDRTYFLPFHLVAKVAIAFLGNHELSLIEVFKERKKVYCWTIYLDKRGRPKSVEQPKKSEKLTYEGLEYTYIDPSEINFY